jgi:hypothetical protein
MSGALLYPANSTCPVFNETSPIGLSKTVASRAICRLYDYLCKIDGMPMVGAHLTRWNKNVEKSDVIVFKYLEMERRTLHRHHD